MVQISNIFKFVVILKSLEFDNNNFNTLSRIHSQIECLDVDLLISYIKQSNIESRLKESLISLINTYYDYIDDKINDYDEGDARKYLSILKEKALVIYKDYYSSLLKLCST